ncbi:MAG: hypothetical protein ACYDA8_06810 [Deferrisomatales bacterium]
MIVLDANVLINLIHARRLGLLAQLAGLEFVVPEEVVAEVSRPEQREVLAAAVGDGYLHQVPVSGLAEVEVYAELHGQVGKGEAACLALAATRGWIVASDEKGRFRREALRLLGEGRLLTTPGLFLLAIRRGVLGVRDADEAKELLARHRFVMPFKSFQELV